MARWQFGLGRENGLTFWGMTFLEASFGSFFALWPLWIEELGASIGTVGLLLGLGGVLRLFALAPSAWLSRRFGLTRVLVVARTVATIGIFSASLAPSWPWLLPALAGMAVGDMAFPLVSTSVALNAGAQRVRAFAIILTMGPSVSLMITPVLSGGLVSLWGLRSPFVASACFSAVSVVFLSRLRPVVPPDLDEHSAHDSYLGVLRYGRVRQLLGLQLATFFALGMGTSLLSNYLHDRAGYAESTVATLTAATAVGSIVFSMLITRSARLSHQPLRAVALTAASAACGYLLFLRADLLPLVLLGLTLRGGFFAAWPLYAAVLGEATPERQRPHVFALGEILAGSGFVAAPVFAGQLYAIRPELPFYVAVAMLVPLVVTLTRFHVPRAVEAVGNREADGEQAARVS
jgi:MFS family permease